MAALKTLLVISQTFVPDPASVGQHMADVCVVWSDTAFSPTLGALDFWNGIFTCNVQTRDSVAWSRFKMSQLANNHLISADPFIRDRVAKIEIGDQIRVKGSLALWAPRTMAVAMFLSLAGCTGQPGVDPFTMPVLK